MQLRGAVPHMQSPNGTFCLEHRGRGKKALLRAGCAFVNELRCSSHAMASQNVCWFPEIRAQPSTVGNLRLLRAIGSHRGKGQIFTLLLLWEWAEGANLSSAFIALSWPMRDSFFPRPTLERGVCDSSNLSEMPLRQGRGENMAQC